MSPPSVVLVYWWEIQWKFFVNLTVNFGEIQHFTRPGIFGTGYTSTHTQVNIQKTNYTAPLLFLPCSTICQILWAAPSPGTQSCHSTMICHILFSSWTAEILPDIISSIEFVSEWLKAFCSDLTLVQLFLTASTW